MNFNIDITIVVLFLLSTLIIGLGHGRSVTNIKEYALGGRNFSTGALVATLVATVLGGGAFATKLSRTYSDGLYYVIPSFGMAVSYLILAKLFVPRMGEFLGKTSIAEAMGDMYGQKVRIITALSGTIGSVGGIAIQFKVFGSIITYFAEFSPLQGILLSASIVTVYSAIGGVKAVTFTDFVQSITFGLAMPIIGVMIWNHAYYEGFSFAHMAEHSKNFDIVEVLDISTPEFWSMVALFLYYVLPSLKPFIFQRISMGRDISQVKKAFVISSVVLMVMTIAMQLIPFLLYNIDPTVKTSALLGYMIEKYTIAGFKGMVVAGVLALAMSTADSIINSSSVLFANDICKPYGIAPNKELAVSKIFAIVLGIAGVLLAVVAKDLLSIILIANSFYMPIVTAPMMISILGFRSSTKSVLIGMGAGGITVLVWKIIGINADPIAIAMLVNIIFLVGSHYLLKQEGGWVGIKDQKSLDATREVSNNVQPKDKSIIAFCKRHAPTDDLPYISLGVYIVIYAITTMYLTQSELAVMDKNYFILVMYQMILVSGILLIIYPVWPNTISTSNKIALAKILWYFIIFIMLVVFNTFFAIIAHFEGLQLSVFTTNLLIVSVLAGWRASIWMILIGCYLGILLHSYYNPLYNLDVTVGSPGFIMSYVAVLVGAALMLFFKPKQDNLEEAEAKVNNLENEVTHLDHELLDLSGRVVHYSQRVSDQEKEIERLGATAQKILNNVNHELRLPIGNVMNFSDMLHEALQKSDKKLQELSEAVFKSSTRVSTMILNMLDLATIKVKQIDLLKKTINFGELVEDRVRRCRKIYLQGKRIDFELSIQPEIMISIDPNYVRQMVDNIIINAISYSKDGLIKVIVKKENDHSLLIVEDEGIGIAEEDLYDIFNPFKMGSKTESKAEGRGIGLALCKSVVEAHDGKITAENNKYRGAKFKVLLPI